MQPVSRRQLLVVGLVLGCLVVGGVNLAADGLVASVFGPAIAGPSISPSAPSSTLAWSVAQLDAAPEVLAPYTESGYLLPGASYLGPAALATPADPSGAVPILITLAFSNESRLAPLLANLSDPASPQYHHYLTAAEFTDEFGALPSVYGSVVNYLASFGVTALTTHADRLSIGFTASTSQLDTIFHTPLGSYQSAAGEPFYAPLALPTIPAPLAPYILDVEGLSDYSQYQNTFVPISDLAPVTPAGASTPTAGVTPASGGTPSPGTPANPFLSTTVTSNGLTNTYDQPVNFNLSTQSGKTCDSTDCGDFVQAADLQVAYNETGLFQKYGYPVNATVAAILWSNPICHANTGSCASEGLYNYYCSTLTSGSAAWDFFMPDVTSFWNYSIPAGEPMPSASSMAITGYTYAYPTGSQGYSASCDDGEAEGENTLDVDMLGSMAPGANVFQVFGGSASSTAIDTVFSDILSPATADFVTSGGFDTASNIADLDNVSVITNSWTSSVALLPAWSTDLQTAAARGITVLGATGDSGTTIDPPAEIGRNTFGTIAVSGTTAAINVTSLLRGPPHLASPASPYYGVGTGEIGWYEPAGTVDGFSSTLGGTGGVASSTSYYRPSFINASADASSICNAVRSGDYRCEPDISGIANDTIVDLEVGPYSLNFTCWVTSACTRVSSMAVGVTAGSSPTVGGTYFVGTSIADQVVGGEIATIDHALYVQHESWVGYANPTFYAQGQLQYTGDLTLTPFYDVTTYTDAGGLSTSYEAKAGFDLATGWGVVDAGNFTRDVMTFPLTFTETGLASGTSWSVTVTPTVGDANCTLSGSTCSNSQTKSTTGGSITFNEPYGGYGYTVGSVAGFTASPGSGTTAIHGAAVSVGIAFSAIQYSVTFTESGLPSGTLWSVTLAGTPMSSTGTSIVFSEPDGTYSYSVLPIAGYLASPSSGSVTVSNAAASKGISFSVATFGVSFTETGLPSGTDWSVTLDGTMSSSVGSTIGFTEPNGTYSYSVGAVPGYTASPSGGSVLVDGSAVSVGVTFAQVTYPVTFQESGLPASTEWSVVFDGGSNSSSTTSIGFTAANGSYSYSVGAVPGYTVAPNAGTVDVSGAAVAVDVTYSVVTYLVTFSESDLPSGTQWSVDLGGSTEHSTTASIAFSEPNGSYAYSIGAVPGYTVAPNAGTVDVSGAPASVGVVYSQVLYSITFEESVLPLGTSWSITLAGTPMTSTGTSITFVDPNGSYGYTVGAVPGYTANQASGTVVVAGDNPTVTVGYTLVTYPISFEESGLASGTDWAVTFNGSTSSSTGTAIGFTAANGTYGFSVGPVPGYTASPNSGTVVVNGAARTVDIAFTVVTYSVTFSEGGLPSGTAWAVTLAGTPNGSTGSSIGFTEPNGTYSYSVGAIPGYTADHPAGDVTVDGADVAVDVTFSQVTYSVTFAETGLPSGTLWSVTLGGDLASGTTAALVYNEPNGTYGWTIGTVTGFSSNVSSGSVVVDGGAASVDVAFAPLPVPHYAVTFEESGLPTGTDWSVTFNGSTSASTSSAIVFSAENGSYSFTVGTVAGYTVNVSGGSIAVAGGAVTVYIGYTAIPPATYSVAFEENGLAGELTWGVVFAGTPGNAASGAPIGFSATNGSYAFSVDAVAGYTANVTGGTIVVDGSPVTVYIGFSAIPPAMFSVEFEESGLASGTPWSVTLAGTPSSSTSASIDFLEANGTYSFTVGAVAGYTANVTAGTVIVDGSAVTVEVGFTANAQPTYAVTFALFGGFNPDHVAWTVTLNGIPQTTTGASLVFQETNGTYTYTLSTVPGYAVGPSSGHVTVAGAGQTVEVVLTPEIFGVDFEEMGLPAGKAWTVYFGDSAEVSTAASLNFSGANGQTYPYLIVGPSGERVTGFAPSGTVTFAGHPVTVNLAFARGTTYGIVATESGLPRGQSWCVAIGAWNSCVTTATTRLVDLSPGAYLYSLVAPTSGQTVTAKVGGAAATAAGTVVLGSRGTTIAYKFVYDYAITFTEAGLANGSEWSVKVGGLTQTATAGTAIVFDEKNGSHTYSIGAEVGYKVAGSPSRAHIVGGPVSIAVTFSPKAPHGGAPGPSSVDPGTPVAAPAVVAQLVGSAARAAEAAIRSL